MIEAIIIDDELDLHPSSSDILLHQEPTMENLMKMMATVIANTSDIQQYKATTTQRLDTVVAKTDATDKRLDQIEQAITRIESAPASSSSSNDWFEQRKLRNNVSIIGLSPIPNENLKKTVNDLCTFLRVPLGDGDIDDAYRVTNNRSNMIIVKFRNFTTKLSLLRAKTANKMHVSDIRSSAGVSADASNGQIFINSHMTPPISRMLQRARSAVKDGVIASCWITGSALMLKATKDAPPLQAKSIDELVRILDSGKTEPVKPKPVEVANGKRSRPRNANDSLSPKPAEMPPTSKQRTSSKGRPIIGPKSVMKNHRQKMKQ